MVLVSVSECLIELLNMVTVISVLHCILMLYIYRRSCRFDQSSYDILCTVQST